MRRRQHSHHDGDEHRDLDPYERGPPVPMGIVHSTYPQGPSGGEVRQRKPNGVGYTGRPHRGRERLCLGCSQGP